MAQQEKTRLRMEDPASYVIRVQGYLDEIWSDRLGNMTITMASSESQAPVTILKGKIKDQSELVGVLNGLHQMRVPILSIEMINRDIG